MIFRRASRDFRLLANPTQAYLSKYLDNPSPYRATCFATEKEAQQFLKRLAKVTKFRKPADVSHTFYLTLNQTDDFFNVFPIFQHRFAFIFSEQLLSNKNK